jgi:hypothetical protein
MSQTLKINNFSSLNIKERTELDADAAAAATSLSVKNNQDFAANDIVYVGRLGSDTGEKVVASGISNATTIGVSALARPHNRFDDVHSLFGNKIKVYRAANVDGTAPSDASFSSIATIDIDYDQPSTSYTDSSGGSDYWYKFTFYNSTASTETTLPDSTAARGASYGLYCSVDDVKQKAGLQNNKYLPDSLVDQKRQAAKAYIDAELTGLYTVPFTVPINPLIREVAQLLAAGYLLTSEFGASSASTRAQGEEFIKNGLDILTRINNKELKLTGVTGAVSTVPDAGGFNAWPNGDTATALPEVGGAERQFRMADRY